MSSPAAKPPKASDPERNPSARFAELANRIALEDRARIQAEGQSKDERVATMAFENAAAADEVVLTTLAEVFGPTAADAANASYHRSRINSAVMYWRDSTGGSQMGLTTDVEYTIPLDEVRTLVIGVQARWAGAATATVQSVEMHSPAGRRNVRRPADIL